MASRLLRLHGKVQGVCFRDSAVMLARALELAGWVRNRSDGTLEILLEGSVHNIEAFLRWVRIGPREARVDRVDSVELGVLGLTDFVRRPTL